MEEGRFERGNALFSRNDTLWLSAREACNDEICIRILLFDEPSGELLDEFIYPDFRQRGSTFNEIDGEIYIGGYSRGSIEAGIIKKINPRDGSSVDDTLYHPDLVRVFNTDMLVFGDYIIHASDATLINGSNEEELVSVTYWYDLSTQSIVYEDIKDFGFNHNVTDLELEGDSLLLVSYIYQDEDNFSRTQRKIEKYNLSHELVWEWESLISERGTWPSKPQMVPIDSGGIVYIGRHSSDEISPTGSIRCLDADGDEKWVYDFLTLPTGSDIPFRLKRAKNGDIIGSGSGDGNGFFGRRAIIFRISTGGEMLWYRYYYDSAYVFNSYGIESIVPSSGLMYDIIELDDGDIVMAGSYNMRSLDDDGSGQSEGFTWVMRLDEHGCLGDRCGGDGTITSIYEATKEKEEFIIYPNPVLDELYLSSSFATEVTIYDSQLREVDRIKVNSANDHRIATDGYLPGVYFIRAVAKDGTIHTKKMIKM